MKVLVIGGTGTVGSEVCRQLLARDADVRVLSRDADKIAQLPQPLTGATGDLLDPSSVQPAFDGIDSVFIVNAVSHTETFEGLAAVNLARAAGVERIAYLSVHLADRAPHVPNFGAKLPVEAAIAKSGIAHTILRANTFYQNDLWYRDVMLGHSVYPQPLGDVGVSHVDVRDIAEVAAIALTGAGAGGTYNLVGPEVHTGDDIARLWSEALERPIAYGGNDLDAWAAQALAVMPAWLVFELRLMYAHIQQYGLVAEPADIEKLTALLGRPPRRFADFVAETRGLFA